MHRQNMRQADDFVSHRETAFAGGGRREIQDGLILCFLGDIG
jgi:hypothetical protein